MKIYYETGYINIEGIVTEGYPFNFIISARGTGKTYDALRFAKENNIRFMFMRRTQSQCDLISKPEFSPFKPLNNDYNWNVQVKSVSKYNSMFYSQDGDNIIIHGYTCALSTIANMRGFDGSDIDLLIYDEFIPEKHERLLKNEAEALFNAYETLNRNRELKGFPPIQLLCMANANDITNPVFEYLGLIRIADRMQKGNQDRWTDEKRGIQLIIPNHSPISKRKNTTALYKLTSGSDFANMAIENSFNVNRQHVKSRPITEYIPVCQIGELFIYRHKNETRFYGTTYKTGVFNRSFTTSDSDKLRYKRLYMHQWDLYIDGKIDFQDVLSEQLFLKYWDV